MMIDMFLNEKRETLTIPYDGVVELVSTIGFRVQRVM